MENDVCHVIPVGREPLPIHVPERSEVTSSVGKVNKNKHSNRFAILNEFIDSGMLGLPPLQSLGACRGTSHPKLKKFSTQTFSSFAPESADSGVILCNKAQMTEDMDENMDENVRQGRLYRLFRYILKLDSDFALL